MLPTVNTLKGFKVRLDIAAKETYCNRTMAISMFKYTSDPSHQTPHIKSNYMPHPNEIGTLLFFNQPNQHSSQLIRNHDTISRNDRDNYPSS